MATTTNTTVRATTRDEALAKGTAKVQATLLTPATGVSASKAHGSTKAQRASVARYPDLQLWTVVVSYDLMAEVAAQQAKG